MNKANINNKFYHIMKYPLPEKLKYFSSNRKFKFGEKYQAEDNLIYNPEDFQNFGREKKAKNLDAYIKIINKYGYLYRSLPFVKAIYICNSLTFNSIQENTDIDLFIITYPHRLRLARFFSLLIFFIWGLKRSRKNGKMKFCLSFYITENKQNLYNLTLKPIDIYFYYWIRHLVPLYVEEDKMQHSIFQHNSWLQNYFNYYIPQGIINIGNILFIGNNFFKKLMQQLFSGFMGNILEKIIKYCWLPILIYKTKLLGQQGKYIIISDEILKFYGNDIRTKINFMYKIFKK